MERNSTSPRAGALRGARWTVGLIAVAVTVLVASRFPLHSHARLDAARADHLPRVTANDLMVEAQALHVAANLLGVPLEPEEAKRLCFAAREPTPLQRVALAARPLAGIEAEWKALPAGGLAACGDLVAVEQRSGRVVVLAPAFGDGWADLFEEAVPAQRVRLADLDVRPGDACVTFRRAVPAGGTDGRLGFDFVLRELGVIEAGEAVTASFPIVNRSPRPVTLRVEDSAVGTRATLDPPTLAPGASGVCTLQVDVATRRGPFVHHALVATTDPLVPEVRFIVQGTAFNPNVLVDLRGLFPPTRQGRTSTCELRLKDPGDGSLEIQGLELLSVEPPSLAPTFALSLRPRTTRGSHYILPAELALAPEAPMGPWRAHAALRVGTSRGERRCELVLEGTIESEILAEPPVLHFAAQAAAPAPEGGLTRTVTLTRASGRPAALAEVRVPPELPLTFERSSEGTDALHFMLPAAAAATLPAAVASEIELYFTGGERLLLPVFFHRESGP